MRVGDYVYVTSARAGAVKRVRKAGGPVELVAASQKYPGAIVADGQYVYWTTFGTVLPSQADAMKVIAEGEVFRAPVAGGRRWRSRAGWRGPGRWSRWATTSMCCSRTERSSQCRRRAGRRRRSTRFGRGVGDAGDRRAGFVSRVAGFAFRCSGG